MSKRIYISADYDYDSGDRNVVELINKWSNSTNRIIEFTDMAKVVSGSITLNNPDCRPCEIKNEFNKQINLSSSVIFVVGDKTRCRTSGSQCLRDKEGLFSSCTPYKNNANGIKMCKEYSQAPYFTSDVFYVNTYSYLRHEFEQAKLKRKKILILYNSTRYENSWLPSYMSGYESFAYPFWIISNGQKIGNYQLIKDFIIND